MSMLKKTILFVILVSLVCLTTFPPNGECEDDWVKYYSDDNGTLYYKPSSVKIDKHHHFIIVWTKKVYTDKGRDDFFKFIKGLDYQKYIDLNSELILFLFDYKEWKQSMNQIIHYSKSGNILFNGECPTNWTNIIPGTSGEYTLNQILVKYNIQK